ncbi:unnamed protein product [Caenorhabditis sp. 36 PRJEB53466]|nr:unnamed protein product [Caenorhabditis sp. 36 PRJEB53466]
MLREETPVWMLSLLITYLIIILLVMSISAYMCGQSYEQEFETIRRAYPSYEQSFRSLTNFAIYDLNIYWGLLLVFLTIGTCSVGFIFSYSTKRMFETLSKLRRNTSATTYKKQRMALISLMAQLATALIVIIPPFFLALFLIVEFNGNENSSGHFHNAFLDQCRRACSDNSDVPNAHIFLESEEDDVD